MVFKKEPDFIGVFYKVRVEVESFILMLFKGVWECFRVVLHVLKFLLILEDYVVTF